MPPRRRVTTAAARVAAIQAAEKKSIELVGRCDSSCNRKQQQSQ